ncbi:MAG: hypothetical protein PVI92_16525, partial [Chromatiales bacterium]
MKKLLIGFTLISLSPCAFSFDGSVDISNCPTVSIVVGNVDDASGWGGHFSTSPRSDGYGGSVAECHLTGPNLGPQTGTVLILCSDGYANPDDHVDYFRLDLGPRNAVKQVEFKVTARGVAVEVVRHSNSGFTTNEYPYVIS